MNLSNTPTLVSKKMVTVGDVSLYKNRSVNRARRSHLIVYTYEVSRCAMDTPGVIDSTILVEDNVGNLLTWGTVMTGNVMVR